MNNSARCQFCCTDGDLCAVSDPESSYLCCRPHGHSGPHVACAGPCKHSIATWGQVGDTSHEVVLAVPEGTPHVSLLPCPFCGATEEKVTGKVFSRFYHKHECWLLSFVCYVGNESRVWHSDADGWNQRHAE